MALLQIAEPGLSTSPHEHRLAVGIDLGTTHSLVAAVRHSSTDVLPDEQGRFLLPSIVHYQANGKVSVGYEALAAQMTDPSNTIASVKRLMGRGITDLNQTEQTQLALEPFFPHLHPERQSSIVMQPP
jgi:molecular chaperone HscA